MEKFLQKKLNNNGTATPTSGNKRNAPDPSSTPSSAARNSQSSSSSSSSSSGGGINLSRPVSSTPTSSTGGVSRPSVLGARPSPASVSSGGSSFASPMFLGNRNEEPSSEFAPQQQRPPPPPSPAQQRPFLQLGESSPAPRFGALTAPSSTRADPGIDGGNPRGALSGFGCFKSNFFNDSPSANGATKTQTSPPAGGLTSAPVVTCSTTTSGMDATSTTNPAKTVPSGGAGSVVGFSSGGGGGVRGISLAGDGDAGGVSLGGGGSGGVGGISLGGGGGGGAGSVSSRDGKAGGGGRGSLLGKFSRAGSNIATRGNDADDNSSSDITFEQDQDQGRPDPRTSEATSSFRRPGSSTQKPAETQLKSPPSALPRNKGKHQGPASAPQQQKPLGLSILRRPSLSRGGGSTEGSSADNRFDVGGGRKETGRGGREMGGGGRGDNTLNENDVSTGGRERLNTGNEEMGFPTESEAREFEEEDGGRGDAGSGGPAGGGERLGMGNREMELPGESEARGDGRGRALAVAGPLAAAPKRSSAVARPSSVAGGDGHPSSTAAEDGSQRPDASGRNDVMGLLDDEADAEETRAKMAQREEWIRQKDAAMARFRRECKAEVDRIKSLMEEHVAELETLLDAELVDALDDTIGEKIEDNQREKTRARKVKSLVSAFFDDPRVPKSQRVMW